MSLITNPTFTLSLISSPGYSFSFQHLHPDHLQPVLNLQLRLCFIDLFPLLQKTLMLTLLSSDIYQTVNTDSPMLNSNPGLKQSMFLSSCHAYAYYVLLHTANPHGVILCLFGCSCLPVFTSWSHVNRSYSLVIPVMYHN